MDISLIIWSMTLVMELFSGYLIVQQLGTNVDALFPIMMMLVGIVFLFLIHQEKTKQVNYADVFYKGYEQKVYYLNYIVIFIINIAIITKLYQHFSMTSPVLMLTWLLPMISYSLYQNVVICKDKEIKIANKYILYKDIKSIKVEADKKKYRLYINGRDKNYYYIASKEVIETLKGVLQQKNKHLK